MVENRPELIDELAAEGDKLAAELIILEQLASPFFLGLDYDGEETIDGMDEDKEYWYELY